MYLIMSVICVLARSPLLNHDECSLLFYTPVCDWTLYCSVEAAVTSDKVNEAERTNERLHNLESRLRYLFTRVHSVQSDLLKVWSFRHSWNKNMSFYLTGDMFVDPQQYGSVLERYWLNSEGVAIYVAPEVPLHVSIERGQICLKGSLRSVSNVWSVFWRRSEARSLPWML